MNIFYVDFYSNYQCKMRIDLLILDSFFMPIHNITLNKYFFEHSSGNNVILHRF